MISGTINNIANSIKRARSGSEGYIKLTTKPIQHPHNFTSNLPFDNITTKPILLGQLQMAEEQKLRISKSPNFTPAILEKLRADSLEI